MTYVCHKVGALFPLCESCETYTECKAEADKHNQIIPPQEITATAN